MKTVSVEVSVPLEGKLADAFSKQTGSHGQFVEAIKKAVDENRWQFVGEHDEDDDEYGEHGLLLSTLGNGPFLAAIEPGDDDLDEEV